MALKLDCPFPPRLVVMPLPVQNRAGLVFVVAFNPCLSWFITRATSAARLALVERRMTSLSLTSTRPVQPLLVPAMVRPEMSSRLFPPGARSAAEVTVRDDDV